MDVSDSSSEDDDIYINAASKLNALNSKKNHKIVDDEDEEDDENLVEEVVQQEENPSSSKCGQKNINDVINVISHEENMDLEQHVISSEDDEAVVCVTDKSLINNDTMPKRTTRNSNKRNHTTPSRVEDSINDSIEQELNREDSFQLSQDEDDSFIMIGSPPPAKKMNLDDYEVNVKVLWKSNKVERFHVRMNETLEKLFKYFANLEGVLENQIFITKKEKLVTPFDTPASIGWTVLDILDGGVVSADVAKRNKVSANKTDDLPDNSCKIKIQTSDKRTLTITMKNDESFSVLLKKCSEQLEVSESKIKLFFDGELIDVDETPESLDIDEEACVDLKIIQ